MFRKAILIGLILPIALYVCKALAVGVSKIQTAEFKPVFAVFLLDISASSRGLLDEEQDCIVRIARSLDSDDHIKIYVVTEDAYEVYDGTPHKASVMRKAMRERSVFDSQAYGTAYGLALKKAVGDALRYKTEGYTPAIIVLGDLENEGALDKQINWNTLPKNISNTLKYIPDLSLTFLYADPKKLDSTKQTLITVLKEDKLIIAAKENVELAMKKFEKAIGR